MDPKTLGRQILIDVPERLETPRLVLRVVDIGEGAAINAVVVESAVELGAWMPWASPTPSVDDTETWCRQMRARFALREEAAYVIRLRDEAETIVGTCGVWCTDATVPRFELGYWVRTTHKGIGIASEAATVVTKLAFDAFGAERIEIRCDDRNDASGRVAQRCGYTFEGVLHRHSRDVRGGIRDTRVYAKLADRTDGAG